MKITATLPSDYHLNDADIYVLNDSATLTDLPPDLKIAGVDVSFDVKGQTDMAVAGIVITDPNLNVLYQNSIVMHITEPYVSGQLALRELPAIRALVEGTPDRFKPDIITCDGNGYLHPNRFGCACSVGQALNLTSIGIAKNLCNVTALTDRQVKNTVKDLNYLEALALRAPDGEILGAALKSSKDSFRPLYVSAGWNIDLVTALTIARRCLVSDRRNPIQIALADRLTRDRVEDLSVSLAN